MADKRPGAEKRKLLTDKQARFVEEYLVDLNATKAAERAGYSPKTAYTMGHQTKNLPHVAAAIAARRAVLSEKAGITTERVLAELALLGFANMADYLSITEGGEPFVDLSTMDRAKAAAITEATVEDFREGRGEDARDVRRVKIKLSDKRAALVDIGKHLGMFKDQVELTGANGGPVQVDDVTNSEAARRIAFLLSAADRATTKH